MTNTIRIIIFIIRLKRLTKHDIGTGVHCPDWLNDGHAEPPHEGCRVILRDLDLVPALALHLPGGALHLPHADQLETKQSLRQQPPLHDFVSTRVGHAVPLQEGCVRTVRVRVCLPVCSQAALQAPQLPQLLTTQFTGQHLKENERRRYKRKERIADG